MHRIDEAMRKDVHTALGMIKPVREHKHLLRHAQGTFCVSRATWYGARGARLMRSDAGGHGFVEFADLAWVMPLAVDWQRCRRDAIP